MKRHYYISESLQELVDVETELENEGVTHAQIHVLSDDDRAVEQHNLNEVEAVLKQDVVRSTEIGAVVGVVAAGLVLLSVYLSGIAETTGWVPFIFLAVVALGFCTWEGGLFGIQVPHAEFQRFKTALTTGKHILFVDIREAQEAMLAKVINHHPQLELAGTGSATPDMVISAQDRMKAFIKSMP
ncbi:MAG: NAD/FAD-utilizing enzyme [Cellvibrionaceae bacterium]|nr:NAD/FAD-utilizing enzyme [Cellvibrionaceae bacterium]|tara:strand:- start:11708 stop:12262 length:555 start_codon:yes stop_codon:yes gene_type:complete